MNGATLYEAAEVLGLKSVETTRRHAHLRVGHKQKLTDRVVDGIFKGWVLITCDSCFIIAISSRDRTRLRCPAVK